VTRFRVGLVPRAEANAFVAQHHRHSGRVLVERFSLGAFADDHLIGVVIVANPVARLFDASRILEVRRCCTDGTPNACSFLYAAAWREARRRGWQHLITYTLATERGTSLRAAGWTATAFVRGKTWHTRSRPRDLDRPTPDKFRWERFER
jgi:hypothetical protein